MVVPAVDGVTVDDRRRCKRMLSSLRATSVHDMAQVPLVTRAPQRRLRPAVPRRRWKRRAAGSSPHFCATRSPELDLALTPADMRGMRGDRGSALLGQTTLTAYVEGLAAQIDRPARDQLRFNPATGRRDNCSRPVPPARAGGRGGQRWRLCATPLLTGCDGGPVGRHRRGARSGYETASPRWVFTELVAMGRPTLPAAAPASVHNVEVAAMQFDGVVIPPIGFSFNDIVRDVSSDQRVRGICWSSGASTAVGVGGGVVG